MSNYLKVGQIETLKTLYANAVENHGYLDSSDMANLKKLVHAIEDARMKANVKTNGFIKHRRKTDKSYARSEKEKERARINGIELKLDGTLMEALIDAGYPVDQCFSHYSDLYVYATPLTDRVIREYYVHKGQSWSHYCTLFRDQISEKPMYDCAFAYDPYWKEKENVK